MNGRRTGCRSRTPGGGLWMEAAHGSCSMEKVGQATSRDGDARTRRRAGETHTTGSGTGTTDGDAETAGDAEIGHRHRPGGSPLDGAHQSSANAATRTGA